MSAETELIALLTGAPELAGKRIFINAADEQTALPYVVITATHDIELLLDSTPDLDHVTFTIACWGTGAAMAEALCDTVEAVLDTDDEYAILNRTGGFDQDTGDDAAVITADRWV